MKPSFLLIILLISLFQQSNSHGRFMKPPNRSSVWRDPEFSSQNPPKNYEDNELFCGSVHQTENPGTKCGGILKFKSTFFKSQIYNNSKYFYTVCGDPQSDPVPRANEVGGKWYQGIITGQYKTGDVIEVAVELTMSHKGFMEWRLCTDYQTETQDCFNKHLLQKADGTGSRVPVTETGWYKANLSLPAGVSCSHCVIQWNYRGGKFVSL